MDVTDVTATMKMNDMVKNLQHHGIIDNSEKAMEMASRMYNVEKPEKIVINEEQKSEIKEEPDREAVLHEDIKHLIDKRLKYFVEKNNYVISRELQELWTKLNQLGPEFESKLAQIRNEIEVSANSQPQQSGQNVQSGESGNAPGSQRTASSGRTANENPRSGSYNQDDVSVDKVFYFGQR